MYKSIVLSVFFIVGITGCMDPLYAGQLDVSYRALSSENSSGYMSSIDFKEIIAEKVELSGRYRYAKTNNIVGTDEAEFRAGWDPTINDRWSLWIDESFGYNKGLGIDFQNKLGFGLKYYIYKGESAGFSLSAGILYDLVFMDDKEDGLGRYSIRPKAYVGPISMVYFYQPAMGNMDDYISKFYGEIVLTQVGLFSVVSYYEFEERGLSRVENSGVKGRFEW